MCILFLGPANEDMEWQENGARGHELALPEPDLAGRARGRRRCASQGEPEHGRARPQDARRRSPRSPTTSAAVTRSTRRSAAVMELVNEISKDTSRRPRCALRGRDGRVADPALCAARRRGAVGRARRGRGCGSSRGRWPIPRFSSDDEVEVVVQVNGKVRDRLRVAAAIDGRRAARARARLGARAGVRRRQGAPEDDRRPRQARLARRLTLAPRNLTDPHPARRSSGDRDVDGWPAGRRLREALGEQFPCSVVKRPHFATCPAAGDVLDHDRIGLISDEPVFAPGTKTARKRHEDDTP